MAHNNKAKMIKGGAEVMKLTHNSPAKLTAQKQNKISHKISKIMHEGIKGKKVSQKQAVAVAFSMARKGKL